jgi:hypothetical protein
VDVVGPQGPQGPQGIAGLSDSATGSIQGQVQLYDVHGNPLADNSGASISIEHTSPLVNAISALDGKFLLPLVRTGTYDLDLQKAGYGSMRFLNVQHPGGTQASQTGILSTGQQLDSQYNISLTVDTSSFGTYQYLVVTIKLTHPQIINNPVLLFFSYLPHVTNSNSLYTFRNLFTQQDNSTLVYTGFDESLGQYSDSLQSANYLYISAAIDNVQQLFYLNEQGIAIYPCAGNLSNEVQVFNVLKN